MLTHLIEIRERVLKILGFFLIFFSLFFYYSKHLFNFLVQPLQQFLTKEQSLIATTITSPLTTPLILAANTAILCTAPFALYQIWRFMAPALYRGERLLFLSLIGTSLSLFFLGMIFCYFFILTFLFKFLSSALPFGIKLLPEISSTLSFILHMLLIFGFCFQLPLITVVLFKINWIDLEVLIRARPYAIVIAFIVGMLLTPPDVLSQICLALPLCFLYELSILACKIVAKWSLQSRLKEQ